MFKDFNIDKFKNIKPPSDNSFTTMQEVKSLVNIPMNKSTVKKFDNIEKTFKDIALKNNITNYERHQLSNNHQQTVKTTSYLREAFLEDGMKNGLIGIKTVNRIRDLQNKILRDFTHLNSLPDKEFNNVKKFGQ